MLTPLELDIMKAVWSRPPITVRAVQQAIRPSRELAYTTVMTIMDRLYHKGCLTRTLRSRAHYYTAAIDYSDARAEALEMLIKNFFGSKEKLKEFLNAEPVESRWESPQAPLRELDETLL